MLTGLEPRSFIVGSDHLFNCVTTPALNFFATTDFSVIFESPNDKIALQRFQAWKREIA